MSREVCRFFKRGSCLFGASCKYSHTQNESAANLLGGNLGGSSHLSVNPFGSSTSANRAETPSVTDSRNALSYFSSVSPQKTNPDTEEKNLRQLPSAWGKMSFAYNTQSSPVFGRASGGKGGQPGTIGFGSLESSPFGSSMGGFGLYPPSPTQSLSEQSSSLVPALGTARTSFQIPGFSKELAGDVFISTTSQPPYDRGPSRPSNGNLDSTQIGKLDNSTTESSSMFESANRSVSNSPEPCQLGTIDQNQSEALNDTDCPLNLHIDEYLRVLLTAYDAPNFEVGSRWSMMKTTLRMILQLSQLGKIPEFTVDELHVMMAKKKQSILT